MKWNSRQYTIYYYDFLQLSEKLYMSTYYDILEDSFEYMFIWKID